MNALEKYSEFFLVNNKNIDKNKEFKAFFYQDDENNDLKVIYDNKNFINYILNIPKEKEFIIKEKIEYEILITDSSFDILFYKNASNTISCILILIINDIEFKITNENYLEFKIEQFQNLNDKSNIIYKIKQKIINFLKEKKEKNELKNIESLLLEEKEVNLLYNKNLIFNGNLNKLKSIVAKVEIKTDFLDFNNINENCFMNIYEILSPDYKSFLAQKFFNEIPNNLLDLMLKYQDVYITRDLFDEYKSKKFPKKINIINIENKKKINKNKKIVFHVDKNKKMNLNKKRFKIIFKKIGNKNKMNIKSRLNKNIFKTNKFNEIKKENDINIKVNDKNNNINKNKIKIFKCVNPTLKKDKEFLFLVNK